MLAKAAEKLTRPVYGGETNRWVWIPEPYDHVCWGVTQKKNDKECIAIQDLSLVMRGQATAVFARRSGERTPISWEWRWLEGWGGESVDW